MRRFSFAVLLLAGQSGCIDGAEVVRTRHANEFQCAPAAVVVAPRDMAGGRQSYWTASGCGIAANYVCAGGICAMEREWRVAQ